MKKMIGLCLVFSIVLSCVVFTGAVPAPAVETAEFLEESAEEEKMGLYDTMEYLVQEIPEDAFGGIYLSEDGHIVVNLVDSAQTQAALLDSDIRSDAEIEYQTVDLPLARLEEAHEALVPYMLEYGIICLDANEVTNKLDIEVDQYREDLLDLVGQYLDLRYVNITVTDKEMSFTVRKIDSSKEEAPAAESSVDEASPLLPVLIYPGMSMVVGDYGYTVGPKRNNWSFYSCGHISLHAPDTFTIGAYVDSTLIGYVYDMTLGAEGDLCTVNITDNARLPSRYVLTELDLFPPYTFGTSPYVGCPVMMVGSVSFSTGKVLGTNITVTVEGHTLGNMARASYTSAPGDSGAAVFSEEKGAETMFCYGIQSCTDGATSYFTILK